jgi:2-polyprenyl-6-methoxyphenol hydroxylase-like FAD-dependent oxidoreductase
MTQTISPSSSEGRDSMPDEQFTSCCIVGAGPAGAVLALLLARQGIPVTLLEGHTSFDREFRGDTVHPAIMEILDEIGVADRVLQRPHRKVFTGALPAASGTGPTVDFRRLRTRFPFITMMPQVEFLEAIIGEARAYSTFQLVMGANVQELVEEGGRICGVRYRSHNGWHEVRAMLTVGADGRFSKLRRLAALPAPIPTSPPNDVLWFRLARREEDGAGVMARVGPGSMLAMLDRGAEWQLGYVVAKNSFPMLKAGGIAALRQRVAELAPELADRVNELTDWHQTSYLSVESDRMPRWHRPGLLLIGDAAHIMLPIGGNGINYAVQDAAAAANVVTLPLRTGHLTTRDLAAVQRRREWPTRLTQTIVAQIQKQVFDPSVRSDRLPLPLRLMRRSQALRDLAAGYLAFGIWQVHVNRDLRPVAQVQHRAATPR